MLGGKRASGTDLTDARSYEEESLGEETHARRPDATRHFLKPGKLHHTRHAQLTSHTPVTHSAPGPRVCRSVSRRDRFSGNFCYKIQMIMLPTSLLQERITMAPHPTQQNGTVKTRRVALSREGHGRRIPTHSTGKHCRHIQGPPRRTRGVCCWKTS